MIELSERRGDHCRIGFGGDTLNTAVYLARLGIGVDYVTALGDDPWSDEMVAAWETERIGTGHVLRLPGRLPGLYAIETRAGERSFHYWRQQAAARDLFASDRAPRAAEALRGRTLIYLSGITLSLYGEDGRARLFDALDRARADGARIAFDTNFRPPGWPDTAVARAAYAAMAGRTDIALVGLEDRRLLFGDTDPEACVAWLAAAETVVKLETPGCLIALAGVCETVPTLIQTDAIDTTAAGDSFAAGYLAARLKGLTAAAAARLGHQLAGVVIRHPGAIIPAAAMPAVHFP
jgi:2-dehydro-3-deoxygluconokinase